MVYGLVKGGSFWFRNPEFYNNYPSIPVPIKFDQRDGQKNH